MHILINETMVIILRYSNMLTFLFFIFQIFPKSGNKTDVNRQLSGNVVDRFFHVIISVWHICFLFFVVFHGWPIGVTVTVSQDKIHMKLFPSDI